MAASSSLIDPAIGHLAELAGDAAGDTPGLLTALAGVADPGAPAGSGPRIMASLHTLVITMLRLTGAATITAALHYLAPRPSRPLRTIMNCYPGVLQVTVQLTEQARAELRCG